MRKQTCPWHESEFEGDHCPYCKDGVLGSPPKLPDQIMIDFETLGCESRENCVAVSLGVFAFGFHEARENLLNRVIKAGELSRSMHAPLGSRRHEIELRFDIAEQVEDFNRVAEPATCAWWFRKVKPCVAQSQLFGEPRLSLRAALHELDRFIKYHWVDGRSRIWCRGNDFDFPLLDSLVKLLDNFRLPGRYDERREVRTWIEARRLGDEAEAGHLAHMKDVKFFAHGALGDAAGDAYDLVTREGLFNG